MLVIWNSAVDVAFELSERWLAMDFIFIRAVSKRDFLEFRGAL